MNDNKGIEARYNFSWDNTVEMVRILHYPYLLFYQFKSDF